MPSEYVVRCVLSPAGFAGIDIIAQTEGLSRNEVAKRLLEEAVSSKRLETGERHKAEVALMRWVGDRVAEFRADDSWDENVTGDIFERMRHEIPELHAAAVTNRNAARIHRAIGRYIRKELGAEKRMINGSADMVDLPRGAGHLILGYTKLYRTRVE